MTTYRVSALAERVGLSPSTVRFYEQAGLLPAQRSESGYRLFDDQAVQRIGVINAGKRLGLALKEIRELLQVWEDGLCRDVRQWLRPIVLNQITRAERRAVEIDAFIVRLQQASSAIDGPVPPGRCGGPGCGIGPPPDQAAGSVAVELTTGQRDVEPGPPIACTLTAAERPDRVAAWRRLLSQARSRVAAGDVVAFLFPVQLAGEVAELAAAELECCAFFEFTLHLAAGELRFEVRVPGNARSLLSGLFGAGDVTC